MHGRPHNFENSICCHGDFGDCEFMGCGCVDLTFVAPIPEIRTPNLKPLSSCGFENVLTSVHEWDGRMRFQQVPDKQFVWSRNGLKVHGTRAETCDEWERNHAPWFAPHRICETTKFWRFNHWTIQQFNSTGFIIKQFRLKRKSLATENYFPNLFNDLIIESYHFL